MHLSGQVQIESLEGLRVFKSTLCVGIVAILGVLVRNYVLCCPACWQRICNAKPLRDSPR